jgi:sulfopyruvate decarboxylase alpha subunit
MVDGRQTRRPAGGWAPLSYSGTSPSDSVVGAQTAGSSSSVAPPRGADSPDILSRGALLPNRTASTAPDWPDRIHDVFRRNRIAQVGYVPDAGHARLIERCRDDEAIRDIVLTTEEEGIAMAAGAWLGGVRSAVLMQSSGVGNCVNMLAMTRSCRFPLLMLVTMRGEHDEFNPWQVPMGSTTAEVLRLSGVDVRRVEAASEVEAAVESAATEAFANESPVALLLSQRLIGPKQWVR